MLSCGAVVRFDATKGEERRGEERRGPGYVRGRTELVGYDLKFDF